MRDFFLNIDNKEILIEILHDSVNYLIGSNDDRLSIKKCFHKYGFSNTEDFLGVIKDIASLYRSFYLGVISESELLSNFANMSSDLQSEVIDVLLARKLEIIAYLARELNSYKKNLIVSFDWDLRLTLGDSSYIKNKRQLMTITLNCLEANRGQKNLHFQIDKNQLNGVLTELETFCLEKNDDESKQSREEAQT